jgi:hypothetical protein
MQILQIILYVIGLALSYPVALILARYTKDEINLYKPFFPILAWTLLILSAIFFALNLASALTFLFMFLVIEFWSRFSGIRRIKNKNKNK